MHHREAFGSCGGRAPRCNYVGRRCPFSSRNPHSAVSAPASGFRMEMSACGVERRSERATRPSIVRVDAYTIRTPAELGRGPRIPSQGTNRVYAPCRLWPVLSTTGPVTLGTAAWERVMNRMRRNRGHRDGRSEVGREMGW